MSETRRFGEKGLRRLRRSPLRSPPCQSRFAGVAQYLFGANVVLPFANLSGDLAQDYVVDALTDELTTSLARTTSRASSPLAIRR